MLRLPSAVLVWMADSMLRDADANALAGSCTAMMHAMQRYRWKQFAPMLYAVGRQPAPSASSASSVGVRPQHRFGLVTGVYIPPERGLPLAQLPDLLRRLPSTVVDVVFAGQWTAPVESLVLPASVRTLSLDCDQPLDGLQLPATLRQLSLGAVFSHSLAALSLPDGLEELRLSERWNRPLSDLPPLPPSLLMLEMGYSFNQPLETLQQPWPPQLRTLTLGDSFNRPLQGVRLPETITELRLGQEWNHSLNGVQLPRSLTSLTIAGQPFEHSLQGVTWPAGLLSLSLPYDWNQPVVGLLLPPSLTQLDLGYKFCRSLREWDPPASLTDFALTDEWQGFDAADLRLPEGLTRFAIPTRWSIELADLTLPAGLQSLTLGYETRIADPARVQFPAALTELDLGDCALEGFIPSLAGFVWPPGLIHLRTGSFDGSLLDWTPPASLTQLDLGDAHNSWTQPVSQLLLPPQLTELRLRVCGDSATELSSGSGGNVDDPAQCDGPLAGLVLPLSLRRIALITDCPDPLSGITLPPQLEAIELELRSELRLDELQLPDSLRELRLTGELPQSLRSLLLPASLRILSVSDHVRRSPSDLPVLVPPQLRVVELGVPSALHLWRDWISSNSQVDQRGCVVAPR